MLNEPSAPAPLSAQTHTADAGVQTRLDFEPNKWRKLKCGERHFKDALRLEYKVVKTASELL